MKRWLALAACILLPQVVLAQSGAQELLPQDDPAKNAEIIELLTRAKKGISVESLSGLSANNKAKVMDYYRVAKSFTSDRRPLARGLSGVIDGYSEIEAIKRYIKGDQSGPLPLPYTQFKTALDSNPFPGADAMLRKELELSKQLEDALVAIFRREAAENRREAAEIRKQTEILSAIIKAMDDAEAPAQKR